MTTFEQLTRKPYRHRYPWFIIRFAVVLLAFMSARDVQAVLWWAFHAHVSHKTVCAWSKKFPFSLPTGQREYAGTTILFADEKYVWIRKVQAYWWSVRDHTGCVLASLITTTRDTASAKSLFHAAQQRLVGRVHAVVHDGLPSYPRAVKSAFGRRCQSIVAGITPRGVIVNDELHFLTNNPAESLNAQIDTYCARHHANFNSLESANRFVEMFLSRRHLREAMSVEHDNPHAHTATALNRQRPVCIGCAVS